MVGSYIFLWALSVFGSGNYLLEMSHLCCYFGTRGRERGPLVSLKTGPGKELRKIVATTCSAVRNVLLALEQDVLSGAPDAFVAR